MEPFMSEIRIFPMAWAPKGWASCNGQLMPINQNQALFALLGTNYGGNGQTNFSLPDFRDRVPVSMGSSFPNVGNRGGEDAHTVSIAELPTHTHFAFGTNQIADAPGPGPGNALAATDAATVGTVYALPSALVAMAPMVGNTGGSQPHNNQHPYLCLNFCIALQGLFPTSD
jgi:microcystin-dependent protein